MKFRKIIITILGFFGTLTPLAALTQEISSSTEASARSHSETLGRYQSVNFIVDWMQLHSVMDKVSATEFALSLTEQELKLLVKALQNPKIIKARNDVIPI